jgi:hypothetical protein
VNAATGDIEGNDPSTWADAEGTWADDSGPWSEIFRRRVILADPNASMLYVMDSGNTRNGTGYQSILSREALGIIGRTRKGEWIVDFERIKMIHSIWPKVEGAAIKMRVGYQDVVEGTTVWQDYVDFDPTSELWADLNTNENVQNCGRAFALEFMTPQDQTDPWGIAGYKLKLAPLGTFNGV